MKNFFSSGKCKVLIYLLVLLAGFMAYAFANGRWSAAPQQLLTSALVPFQKLGRMVSTGLDDLKDRTVAIDDVLAENEALKQELFKLRNEMIDYDDMKAENQLYRDYYKIQETYNEYEVVSAFVIGRDPLERYYSFTIDRGQTDGISVDDVVVSPEGIVGVVSQVGFNYAEVLTILDPSVSMGCMISRTRDIGLSEGENTLCAGGQLKMSYLPKETLTAAGDLVVTTGLGGVFPSGLIVGTVADVLPETSGKSMYAVLDSAADISSITSVFVITDQGEAAAVDAPSADNTADISDSTQLPGAPGTEQNETQSQDAGTTDGLQNGETAPEEENKAE